MLNAHINNIVFFLVGDTAWYCVRKAVLQFAKVRPESLSNKTLMSLLELTVNFTKKMSVPSTPSEINCSTFSFNILSIKRGDSSSPPIFLHKYGANIHIFSFPLTNHNPFISAVIIRGHFHQIDT